MRRHGAMRWRLGVRARASQDVAQFGPALAQMAGAGAVVSSFRPIGSEFDPLPLEASLAACGIVIALPVITKLGKPLIFRRFEAGDGLVPRKWGILEPAETAPRVVPDILMLPLLAFDRAGWRLGYGGGFYDRSLAQLRATKSVLAVGLAFCEQEVDAVVHAAYDERLDFVLTPKGLEALS